MIHEGRTTTENWYYYWYRFFLMFLYQILCLSVLFSQETDKIILEAEKSILEIKDTLPEKKEFVLRNFNYQTDQENTENFYDSLKRKASRNRWTNELHDIFFTSPKQEKVTSNNSKYNSTQHFLSYQGFYIRKVSTKKIDVFGPEVYDTIAQASTKLERLANKMHFKTSDNIIRQNVILKEGDQINPFDLSDNERLLRELPYINDARILVYPVEGTDSVDILCIVKDVWSKGFGLEMGSLNSGKFDIWDRNIFGTGHENQNNIYWDSRKQPRFGYEGFYRIKNIGGSFINSSLQYASYFDTEIYELNVSRRFLTPQTKYAGGFLLNNTNTEQEIWYFDSVHTKPIRYHYQNFWFGRSFMVSEQGKFYAGRSNLILTAAYDEYVFFEAPQFQKNLFYGYRSRSTWLTSISYTRQKYYKTNYLYSFGRTEDIPTGMMLQYMYGQEKNPEGQRIYNRLHLSYGNYLLNAGHLYTKFDMGAFYSSANGMEQGIINAKLNYFSKLFKISNFRFRQFAHITYTKGTNNNYDEYLTINNKSGIRGFSSNSLRNHQKLVLNTESVFFSPLYVYGFRFVFYNFVDVGLIGSGISNIFENKIQSGIGIGIRVRNERLVFRTFQLQLAYYPNAPADARKSLLDLSGEPRLRPDNFIPSAPSVLTF